MKATEKARRQFLALAGGAVATLTLAPGVLLLAPAHSRAPDQPVTGKVRWGLLIDTTKCTSGCDDCVTACNRENGLNGQTRPTDAQWIRKIDLKDLRTGRQASVVPAAAHLADPLRAGR